MPRISNEKKNLYRLAGEFLVASRFVQRGYRASLQWGTTCGYDILVFDTSGNAAYIEVKTTASNPKKWALQKRYAHPKDNIIPVDRHFVACVDITDFSKENVYVFPANVVAKGLAYYYGKKFSNSRTLAFRLAKKPRGQTRNPMAPTVGEYINAEEYRENYKIVGIERLEK